MILEFLYPLYPDVFAEQWHKYEPEFLTKMIEQGQMWLILISILFLFVL